MVIIIIIIIIIIVVVVVVDDDTYYWVYLSSNHLFQVYYKVRQVLLQSATAFLLQSATSVITKCDRYYKVWQFYYKVRQYTRVQTPAGPSLMRSGSLNNWEESAAFVMTSVNG